MDINKKELIIKYLNNQCSETELQAIAELFKDASQEKELSEIFSQALSNVKSDFEMVPAHSREVLNRIRLEIERESNQELKRKQSSFRQFYTYSVFRIAASLLFLMLMTYFVINKLVMPESDNVLTKYKTVESPLGNKKKLTLPDGSIAYLNSGTTITYPLVFDKEVRSVSMHGEAFFEVTEDPDRPFTVQVHDLVTRVLGTSFNIRSYDYYGNVKISLASGKIALELPDQDQALILTPGQEATFDRESRAYELEEFDREIALGWQSGILHFHEASEKEVISILEYWYNVRIETINSPTRDWENLTARFDNQSLEDVLISLGFTLDFKHELNGRHVKIMYK